ncbi:MAG: hypothetical protein OJF49_004800 [Ktedonobacterales bacterium]|nr:MAG: hypothetical protein OJF49_004800 [Ktedonobacterales bacterium]
MEVEDPFAGPSATLSVRSAPTSSLTGARCPPLRTLRAASAM